MQVILLEDVKSLGKKGDVVKVSDGYARNFILPKKLGLEATEKNLKELAIQKAEEEARQKAIYDEAVEFGKKLEAKSVTLEIKGGEGGRTFGSVTAKEIAETLKSTFGVNVDKRKINVEEIKQFGTYEFEVKLYTGISAKLYVMVGE